MNASPLPARTKPSGRGNWLLQWRADQRKTIYLCALVLGSCAYVLVIYILKLWGEYKAQTPGHPPLFGDFFALWSYAKIASAHPATSASLKESAMLVVLVHRNPAGTGASATGRKRSLVRGKT